MMCLLKLILILTVTAAILVPATVAAVDVNGDVRGTWTVNNSPYNVVGNLRVARGDSLNIEPGVIVNFQGYYKLLVDTMAVLKAIGTESDSVIFTAQDTAQGWRGIRFIYAGQLSRLSHCRIEYGRATGYDREEYDGGGILCWNSNPSVVNCTIRRNRAEWWGGGICCEEHSNALIAGNTIYENSATYGAGIACSYYAAPYITRNQIYDNSAKTLGGGIYSRYSEPRIEDNLLYGNVGKFRGGGIYCRGSKPKITNITVIQNEAGRVGGGICCVLSQPIIRNAIFWGNSCSKSPEIHSDRSTLTITYSDVRDGWKGMKNIDEDPLFADPKNGDFSLGEGSPCIDTGDPESLPDRDGSVSDMGARFPNWLEDKR